MSNYRKIIENILLKSKLFSESIIYTNKNDLSDIILKNPTKKELKDNNLNFSRVIIDEGNFYFGLASEYDHVAMADNLLSKGIYCSVEYNGSLFYNLPKNTWICREEWQNDEQYKEYENNVYEWLNNIQYIKDNFPNFKVKIIQDEDYDIYEALNV